MIQPPAHAPAKGRGSHRRRRGRPVHVGPTRRGPSPLSDVRHDPYRRTMTSARANGPVVQDLAEVCLDDEPRIGGKAANLGRADQGRVPGPAGLRGGRGRLPRGDGGRGGPRRDPHDRRRRRPRRRRGGRRGPRPRSRSWSARSGATGRRPEAIGTAYRRLGDDVRVAVRSSAAGEDSRDASFAGMNATFTDVAGADAVVRRRSSTAGPPPSAPGRSSTAARRDLTSESSGRGGRAADGRLASGRA